MSAKTAQIGRIEIGGGAPLALIAGPCVIESEAHTLKPAESIRGICAALKMPFVFKASFDKANRSSIHSFRGPGLKEGPRILGLVQEVDSTVHTQSGHFVGTAAYASPEGPPAR